MAFEGLIARLGPTLVREAAPHLLQLVSSFGERFRKDTREMKAAVDAEIASLGKSHATLTAALQKQDEAVAGIQAHLQSMDRKLDRLLETQETNASRLAVLEEKIQSMPGNTRALLLVVLCFVLLTFGVGLALLFVHK